MSATFIPPRDPNEQRMKSIRDKITQVLNVHINGRGKEKKVSKAVDEIISTLRPLLKIQEGSDKGATVMTESATRNTYGKFTKGPSNL